MGKRHEQDKIDVISQEGGNLLHASRKNQISFFFFLHFFVARMKIPEKIHLPFYSILLGIETHCGIHSDGGKCIERYLDISGVHEEVKLLLSFRSVHDSS